MTQEKYLDKVPLALFLKVKNRLAEDLMALGPARYGTEVHILAFDILKLALENMDMEIE